MKAVALRNMEALSLMGHHAGGALRGRGITVTTGYAQVTIPVKVVWGKATIILYLSQDFFYVNVPRGGEYHYTLRTGVGSAFVSPDQTKHHPGRKIKQNNASLSTAHAMPPCGCKHSIVSDTT